jgi:3-hydroxymyristoyl/3-hydroxydecanoyl-(acyl carrier protein) dehydratase
MSIASKPAVDSGIRDPIVVGMTRSRDGIELNLAIPARLLYFRGHFPGFAILPGVVQLDWAIQFGRKHFPFAMDSPRMIKMKFRKPIRPGDRIALSLTYLPARNSLQFGYTDTEGACSSGQIVFAPF